MNEIDNNILTKYGESPVHSSNYYIKIEYDKTREISSEKYKSRPLFKLKYDFSNQ